MSITLLALSLLPALGKSYDCSQLSTLDRSCPMNSQGPSASYPECQVTKLSVSAFIECASAKGPDAPTFSGDDGSIGPLEVLTNAVDTVPCSSCPLAGNLQRAASSAGPNDNFAKHLCDTIHPVDAGLCCLRNCLGGLKQEHSIEAFCNGKVTDLMSAPLIPEKCVSNQDTSDDDGGSGGSDSSGDDPSATAVASDPSTEDYSPSETSSASVEVTQPSTTSPPANGAAATGTTSTPSTPQATGAAASNAGADSGRRMSYIGRVKSLAVAILPIMAVF